VAGVGFDGLIRLSIFNHKTLKALISPLKISIDVKNSTIAIWKILFALDWQQIC
jgi:hypothetical protein